MRSWRAALRIAAREARRARARTALVVAMIALPVLALSYVAVNYDMFRLTPAERAERRLGTADASLTWLVDGPLTQNLRGGGWVIPGDPPTTAPTLDEVRAVLPPGSRVVPLGETRLALRTTTGVGELPATVVDLADPMVRGIASVVEGRAPAGDREMAVSAEALRRLGVGLGDDVTSADGVRVYRVTGVVEFPADLGEMVALPPDAGPAAQRWLVDAPEPVTWEQVEQLNQRGFLVELRTVLLDPAADPRYDPSVADADATVVGTGVLVAGLGVLEVVLLAGPAFAVGARRRRRDLALVAANGGTPAHLRRIVLADGVVLGVVGAAVGIVLGIAAAFAGRPLVEEYVAQARAGGYRVLPPALLAVAGLAVATGVLAAMVPAFTAARQDVVTALSGRRGAVRSRRRWLVVGLVAAATGTALAAAGAAWVSETVMLAGLALAELGLVLCTPSLIGLLARFGRLLPLAPRIALRDTARNRAAAAPAIAAVMAAVAGSVMIGVYLASDRARSVEGYQPALPHGYVTAWYDGFAPPSDPAPVERVAAAARDAGIEVGAVARLHQPTCPPGTAERISCGLTVAVPAGRACPYDPSGALEARDRRRAAEDPRCAVGYHTISGVLADAVVDDGSALPVLTGADPDDLRRATEMLRAGGVVVTEPGLVVDGQVAVEVRRYDPALPPDPDGGLAVVDTVRLPGYALTSGLSAERVVYSPAAVDRLGLAAAHTGFVLATATEPTTGQEDRLRDGLRALPGSPVPAVERGPGGYGDLDAILLAIAAGVVTLGAAGIATGLAAADGRADLSTLAAVGASPRVRRLLSLCQSGMIAGLGSLLGVVAGLTGAVVVMFALNEAGRADWPGGGTYPVTVPWSMLAVVLAVPVVAMLGAGLLTRSRLPVERRIV
ncbi:FtsX-like permease family protein [Polymorphospora sp. NPDC051019]|uniref:FtsX-like permease family protein n=1 Tax=Polymorphospora sp. NPDC051019 TaxID=3155725 RepID=UPI0034122FB1